jgi:predicted XRE-type DNA-binding protein
MSTKQRFASVWDAIEDTPQEAASLRARSALMMGITEAVRAQGLTQAQAAELFGVTQPRISDLMRGKVSLFSLDALVDMASTAGMNPTIKVTVPKKAGTKASSNNASPAPKPAARKSKAQQLSGA